MTLSVVATPGPSLVVSPADIAAHWQIELREPLEPLATIRNLVVRSGAYVIRDSDATVESVRWEHELLGFLHPQVPEVVAPLTAPDGSTYLVADGRVVSVLPFVDGAQAKRSDTRVRHDLPRLLARLHRAALDWPGARPRPGRPSWRELDWVVNDTWDWNVIERTPIVERAYAVSREWVSNPPELTESAVHGDFHPDNLIASERG